MAQANAIIVRIQADAAEEFERLFEEEVCLHRVRPVRLSRRPQMLSARGVG